MASNQATSVRVPLTSWLQKCKSDSSKSRFLKSANKRLFTLDFDAQILYYSHSEGKKNLSMPIHFRQILSVEPFAAPETKPQEKDDLAPGATANIGSLPFSSQAMLQTISSFSGYKNRSVKQHGFVVKLHGRSMELLCSSEEETELWIRGIQDAIFLSHSSGKCVVSGRPVSLGELCSASNSDLSTSPGSSEISTPRSGSHSSGDASPMLAPGGTRQEFPPLAPGLEHWHRTAPLGFGVDIVSRSCQQETPSLAPGASLRATAMFAENDMCAKNDKVCHSMRGYTNSEAACMDMFRG